MPTDTPNARRSKNARRDGAACARDHETDAGDSTKAVHEEEEIEVTEEMIEAGEEVILAETGGTSGGAYFSASALAERVYRAMRSAYC
jgi:hypothetical protein